MGGPSDSATSAPRRPAPAGPFLGVSVVELAGLGPAQHGAMALADLGAEVVRIDRPESVAERNPDGPAPELLARGRRSLALNLKSPAGHDLLERLLDEADVLIDPYRPGVLERLDLDPERLLERNPRLIVARMTGWGQSGPLAPTAGHDINYLAIAGALEAIGDPDRPPPPPLNLVGDFGGGGMLLAFAIATALFERERSGRGQILDVAMVDGVASLLTSIYQVEAEGRWSGARGAHWLQGGAPWYHAYRTADDRFVAVGALEPPFYANLLKALGLDPDEWPQWDEGAWPEQRRKLAEIFAAETMASWVERLGEAECCFAPVMRTDEAAAVGHMVERGTYVVVDGHAQPAPAPRFSRTPGRLSSPPPWPGEHTAEILRERGVDAEALTALRASGAVR
ncbi:MAG TPA: CaiB/BaiF CoA-transferase family protein [Solirubrobacterales bacterium]|nr:CaiB/BaiF CoA-transferase family protein [Solirubrobacterales bacterium]